MLAPTSGLLTPSLEVAEVDNGAQPGARVAILPIKYH